MANDIRFLIGIDGGGTSCRAAIALIDGTILGKAKSGSSNITSNLEEATINIMAAVNDAITAAKLPLDCIQQSAAFLGLAGANVGDFAQRLSQSLRFAKHQIGSDVPIALQGALGDHDGAIAILGTGSAYMSRKADKVRLIGGWGFQLSDLGGGARLGREALELVLLIHDGIRQQSPMTQELFAEFSRSPEKLVLFAKTAKPVDFGKFAPIIVRHLQNGDINAQALFMQSAQSVDAAFDALELAEDDQIALLGGLAIFYPSFLAERHAKRLIEPKADALTGAVALAGKLAAGQSHVHDGRAS